MAQIEHFPILDAQKFFKTSTLLNTRIQELEQSAQAAYENSRKIGSAQDGGFVWIVAVALVPVLVPHLNDNLGSAAKNSLMGNLIGLTWFLFLTYLVLLTVPTIRVFQTQPRVSYDTEIRKMITTELSNRNLSDDILHEKLSTLILRQRLTALSLSHVDKRNTEHMQKLLGWLSAVLIFLLIAISASFVVHGLLKP